MKSRRVCIKTRSPPASLPLKGQVTRHTTVKWPIGKDDLSLGPHLVCRKCLRKVDRFERTLKKLNELEKVYRKNLDQWKTDAESERSKRCSSSPGYGIKKSRPLQPCAPVTSVRRSLNVESVSQPQSCKELEKENMELSINPGNV